jgi:hypothetical protein
MYFNFSVLAIVFSFYLAADMGMPFGYPRISISDLAHYGGGVEQELKD